MITLFVILTLLLTAAIAYLTYRSAQVLPDLPLDHNLLLSPADMLVRGLLCLVCVGLGRLSGLPAEQFGWTTRGWPVDLALGLGLGLVGHLTLYPLTQWAASRIGPSAYSDRLLRAILPRDRREWLLIPIAMGLAVLLEELLFRSLLVGGFSAFAPALPLALAGAFLFGWMHAPQGWLGMLAATGVGLGLSLLFLARGSLIAPLTAHLAFNLLQLVRASLPES